MTNTNQAASNLGGRLALIDPKAMTPSQRALYDGLQATWVRYASKIGVRAETDDGRLIGPFNAFLLHPEITAKLSDLQAAEATETTLRPSVREVAILVVGAIWRADYELYAQYAVAGQCGLTTENVVGLAAGTIPDDLSEDEKLVARLVRNLITEHRVDAELYNAAIKAFGTTGVFDILAVTGVYQTVCSLLALFEVPAPVSP